MVISHFVVEEMNVQMLTGCNTLCRDKRYVVVIVTDVFQCSRPMSVAEVESSCSHSGVYVDVYSAQTVYMAEKTQSKPDISAA